MSAAKVDDDHKQPHDFCLSVLIPITAAELKRFEEGKRVVLAA